MNQSFFLAAIDKHLHKNLRHHRHCRRLRHPAGNPGVPVLPDYGSHLLIPVHHYHAIHLPTGVDPGASSQYGLQQIVNSVIGEIKVDGANGATLPWTRRLIVLGLPTLRAGVYDHGDGEVGAARAALWGLSSQFGNLVDYGGLEVSCAGGSGGFGVEADKYNLKMAGKKQWSRIKLS